jgi:hypothetical protein
MVIAQVPVARQAGSWSSGEVVVLTAMNWGSGTCKMAGHPSVSGTAQYPAWFESEYWIPHVFVHPPPFAFGTHLHPHSKSLPLSKWLMAAWITTSSTHRTSGNPIRQQLVFEFRFCHDHRPHQFSFHRQISGGLLNGWKVWRGRPQTFNNAGSEHGDEIGGPMGKEFWPLHTCALVSRSIGRSFGFESDSIRDQRLGSESKTGVYTHYMREEPWNQGRCQDQNLLAWPTDVHFWTDEGSTWGSRERIARKILQPTFEKEVT